MKTDIFLRSYGETPWIFSNAFKMVYLTVPTPISFQKSLSNVQEPLKLQSGRIRQSRISVSDLNYYQRKSTINIWPLFKIINIISVSLIDKSQLVIQRFALNLGPNLKALICVSHHKTIQYTPSAPDLRQSPHILSINKGNLSDLFQSGPYYLD